MPMRRRNLRRPHILSLVLSLLVLALPASARTWTKELAQGVTLTQKVINPSGQVASTPQVISILKVDPKAPGLRIQAVLAQDRVLGADSTKGREKASSIAKRLNAAAVVNADFLPFFTGDVLSLHISGGELMSEPYPQRPVFGITSDGRFLFDKLELDAKIALPEGKWFPIRGINGPREQHRLMAYTSRFFDTTCTTNGGSEAVVKCDGLPVRVGVPLSGTVTEVRSMAGDALIPDGSLVLSGSGTGAKFIDEYLKPGTSVTMEFDLKPSKTKGWEKVVEAVGGGPWLVKGGKASIDAKDEGFQPGFCLSRYPRTALGAAQDGKLVLVTVDGQQSISAGMTLPQLAQVMLSEGCVEAINLDGGGSTTMATAFGILNSPSAGSERPVANALAVFANVPEQECPDFAITPDVSSVPSGQSVQLLLVDASGQPISADIASQAIWAASGGMGFVDQSGRFYGIKAGSGSVTAKIGARVARAPVETAPGSPDKLTARFEPDPTGAPNRSGLVISVKDLNGNSIEGCSVSVKVTGGTPDQPNLTTAKDGKASTGITWEAAPATPANATVTVTGLPALVVERPK
ncbi:MAG TPA: phosphodiester glycosidase family protein [Armatimonadota bacterium]|nr:phosphodiester glycosidase family protein [Armatimonadota bacterium]